MKNEKRIQYLSFSGKKIDGFVCNAFSSPLSFDSVDLTIVDLGHPEIWDYNLRSNTYVNQDTLSTLGDIVKNTNAKPILIVLPQDISQSVFTSYVPTAQRNLKDNGCRIINDFLDRFFEPSFHGRVCFERNFSTMQGKELPASFYFRLGAAFTGTVLVSSNESNRPLVIREENIIYSSLELSEETLPLLLKALGLAGSDPSIPTWLEEYPFWDDSRLKEDIQSKRKEIMDIEKGIEADEESLRKNLFLKEVLSTTGDELVKRVFAIINELLEIDLSTFVDKYEADFVFKKNDITFVGEIKGVTSNVKNEHISQADDHKSRYEDELADQGMPDERIQKLLIINHQRDVPLADRVPINEKQVRKAIKDETLIVETTTLLSLLTLFREKKIDAEAILSMLLEQKGVLTIEQ